MKGHILTDKEIMRFLNSANLHFFCQYFMKNMCRNLTKVWNNYYNKHRICEISFVFA